MLGEPFLGWRNGGVGARTGAAVSPLQGPLDPAIAARSRIRRRETGRSAPATIPTRRLPAFVQWRALSA